MDSGVWFLSLCKHLIFYHFIFSKNTEWHHLHVKKAYFDHISETNKARDLIFLVLIHPMNRRGNYVSLDPRWCHTHVKRKTCFDHISGTRQSRHMIFGTKLILYTIQLGNKEKQWFDLCSRSQNSHAINVLFIISGTNRARDSNLSLCL